VDLVIPALSLLGLAERPGEAHGLGVIDPALARRLAAAAARNPRSTFGVIVTDQAGRANGYGHATRTRKPEAEPPPEPRQTRTAGPADPAARFTVAGPGPPGGYGAWHLQIGGVELTVKITAIPDGECDHSSQSAGYQPSDTLRRLVQIRDGECTLPVCVRHPRSCEWEHTVPWPHRLDGVHPLENSILSCGQDKCGSIETSARIRRQQSRGDFSARDKKLTQPKSAGLLGGGTPAVARSAERAQVRRTHVGGVAVDVVHLGSQAAA
jgi:hypothetical protein